MEDFGTHAQYFLVRLRSQKRVYHDLQPTTKYENDRFPWLSDTGIQPPHVLHPQNNLRATSTVNAEDRRFCSSHRRLSPTHKKVLGNHKTTPDWNTTRTTTGVLGVRFQRASARKLLKLTERTFWPGTEIPCRDRKGIPWCRIPLLANNEVLFQPSNVDVCKKATPHAWPRTFRMWFRYDSGVSKPRCRDQTLQTVNNATRCYSQKVRKFASRRNHILRSLHSNNDTHTCWGDFKELHCSG